MNFGVNVFFNLESFFLKENHDDSGLNLASYIDYSQPTDLFEDISFENYDYFLNMDYLDTMKMTLHDQNFNLAKQAPWQVKIVGSSNGNFHCDGSFVNRQFIVAARHCIEKLDHDHLRIFTSDHCHDAKMAVKKIHHLQFLTVIQVRNATLKNFPICLPMMNITAPQEYLRIFSIDQDCLIKDAFLKINSTINSNCSQLEICGYSPDSYLCDWIQHGAILTSPEAGHVRILGIANNASQCQNNLFRFWNLKHILTPLKKLIKSGECPRWL